jgi:pyruvate-formate lyase-activating enzyme
MRQNLDQGFFGFAPPQIEMNPDGWSIKGCRHIYGPGSEANEYSALATSPYSGCGFCCFYCYNPHIMHMDRRRFDAGAVLRSGYFEGLLKDAKKYQLIADKLTEAHAQVLLTFASDPYHLGDTEPTRKTLEILIEHGLAFCTLSKGGQRAPRDLDLFRADRDSYACTLLSLDAELTRKWEHKAAPPEDRIATLKAFRDAGIFTWISLEPIISLQHALDVVRETHSFVDLYKIGPPHYFPPLEEIDWRDGVLRLIDLFTRFNVKSYFKRDLQRFLPRGYPNPLRVRQCRDPATPAGGDAGAGSEPAAAGDPASQTKH